MVGSARLRFDACDLKRVRVLGDHGYRRNQFRRYDLAGSVLALKPFDHVFDASEAFFFVVVFHHNDASIGC
jgi:hypothetical protein